MRGILRFSMQRAGMRTDFRTTPLSLPWRVAPAIFAVVCLAILAVLGRVWEIDSWQDFFLGDDSRARFRFALVGVAFAVIAWLALFQRWGNRRA